MTKSQVVRCCQWGLMLLLLVTSKTFAVDFGRIDIKVKGKPLTVELADTYEKRAQGLMFRQQANPGMLFVYAEPQKAAFWMRNTLIPLDLAYINEKGIIVAIIQMQALDETTHPSPVPIIAALEMELGWFAANGIGIGDKIIF